MTSGLAGFDGPGHLNGPTEQKQLFGQRCFASVRVTDDGKGPPTVDFTRNLFGEQAFWFHGSG